MNVGKLNIFKRMSRLFPLVLVFISLSRISFSAEPTNENDVKALFILNFIKYVNWPADIDKSTISIGISGESPVYYSLMKIILKRSENNNIKIAKINTETIDKYQIIFISEFDGGKIEKWMQKYSDKGVLFISENCKVNCVAAINLFTKNKKIKFGINNSGAHQGGVKISSKLMDLATTVEP